MTGAGPAGTRGRIAVVVGNPKPGSRTLAAACEVADALAVVTGLDEQLVVDLATVGPALLDPDDRTVSALARDVAASGLLLVASPTYKATYTGLLKMFFDRYAGAALAGCVTVPMMTGAALIHTMAPDVHLRPLLVELGASVPTPSLYLTESELGDVSRALERWLPAAAGPLRRAVTA